MESWLRKEKESALISIKAFPGSSKNEFAGIRNNRLCIRIAAAPEDNKANDCLCGFIAKTLGCVKRDVVIIKGQKSKLKTVAVPAACAEKLREIAGFG